MTALLFLYLSGTISLAHTCVVVHAEISVYETARPVLVCEERIAWVER